MKESLRQQDYHKVFQKRGDCIRLLAQTSGVVIFFAWFFYRSIWAVPLLFPLGILYFRRCVNRQCRKNRQELTMQFKECILSVANSLRSGYALENAFLESREDIRMLYGEHSAMYRELELIRRGMILNITLEELISDLADRSGIEEIEQFSAILNIAKRGGGNVTQIIRTTAEVISNKVETMQEMYAMNSEYHNTNVERLLNYAGEHCLNADLLIYILEDPDVCTTYENTVGFLSQFAQASEFKMKLELARELIEGKWYITAEYDGKKTKFQLVPIDEINELRKSVGLPASQYTYSARNKDQEQEEPVSKPDFVERAPAGDSVDLPEDGFSMPPMDDEPYPF